MCNITVVKQKNDTHFNLRVISVKWEKHAGLTILSQLNHKAGIVLSTAFLNIELFSETRSNKTTL